ncbi:type II secretion system protein [bacterium]|nr:type II secretion system protein [bacterium]
MFKNSHCERSARRQRTKAFTLAEVLITLGIIGIVAAMTMPAVITKYHQKVTITQLKKAYSTLSQVMISAFPDGDFSQTEIRDSNTVQMKNWFLTNIKPYMKITKYCIDRAGCWNDGTYMLSGSKYAWDQGNIGMGYNVITFITSDGYFVNIDAFTENSYGRFGFNNDGQHYLIFFVDVNGAKRPNIVGKDVYVFAFAKDRGFITPGRDLEDSAVDSNCSNNGTGLYCTEKIIRSGWQTNKVNFW